MTKGSRLLIAGLLVLLGVLQFKLWLGEGSISDVHRLHRQLAEQASENAKLKDANSALEAEVVALKRGTSAVEELARSRLGMIQLGDTFYQYVSPSDPAQAPASGDRKPK
ncbi:hypothetical protein BJI67_07285 [Acidihalobacter aeolianus]|uniref:Cell division protein FtsB n=1 Tax=Acidihalobacter aeolianus TaxID=2792603 RepID=A0A1D8K7I5_9GAMM|nr:cell division protein FtsB [Acidihalobacter aeolianus]AOV16890.1 hypothetical protein BJI67_07285 [Acidihalobacter aeolianus]